jgi:hypothetical protein
MSDPATVPPRLIGRRGLIVGSTAAALAAGLVGAPAAAAAPPPDGGGDTHDGATGPAKTGGATTQAVSPDSSPITTTIASAPISGYVYRMVDMYDFKPFSPAAGLSWGGNGTYSSGTGTTIRASLDIPAGALVKDVEYYIYNNSGSDVIPDSYLYVPGYGSISSIGASVTIPSSATIAAARAVVSQQGPYPLGSRLLVSCATPSTGTVQVNGARVGFAQGAGTLGLQARPVRVYDSRTTGGKFAAKSQRTITLPAALVPAGTAAVSLNLTAFYAVGNGTLQVGSAASTQPSGPSLELRSDGEACAQVLVPVSAGRQITVYTSQAVHLIIEFNGAVS